MHTSHHGVNPCTTLGHIYTTATVIRCPHRESFHLLVRAWRDNDTDEPEVLFEAERDFGPFDDAEYIDDEVRRIVTLAIDAQRAIASL